MEHCKTLQQGIWPAFGLVPRSCRSLRESGVMATHCDLRAFGEGRSGPVRSDLKVRSFRTARTEKIRVRLGWAMRHFERERVWWCCRMVSTSTPSSAIGQVRLRCARLLLSVSCAVTGARVAPTALGGFFL